jgi:tRNA pseudouridine38-40 synthase
MIEEIREGQRGVESGWKLILTYDGTDFHGWQVQPGHATVQGTLADAIARITGERVLPQGSGRTDAGVHALGQVASFTLAAPIPAANFHRALNRALPASIRVLSAASVSADFHARHDAVGKRYEYRIFRGEICPPWLARYVYALNWPLRVEAMREAAGAVLGEHDFVSFAASDPDLAQRSGDGEGMSSIRTIFSSKWEDGGWNARLSGAWVGISASHGAQSGGDISGCGTRTHCCGGDEEHSRSALAGCGGADGSGERIVPGFGGLWSRMLG